MAQVRPALAGPYQPARDQMWKSFGSGVVYEPARTSWRTYRRLMVQRAMGNTPKVTAPGNEIVVTSRLSAKARAAAEWHRSQAR